MVQVELIKQNIEYLQFNFKIKYKYYIYHMYKIYNIKYLEPIQYGGDIITYVPEYPMNLGESRSAEWPPSINEKITVKDPNSTKNYSGIVIDNIWNETASIVKLQDQDYTELSFKDEPKYNNGKGFFLLLPDYYWSSIDKPLDIEVKQQYIDSADSNQYLLEQNKLQLEEYQSPSVQKVNPLSTVHSKPSTTVPLKDYSQPQKKNVIVTTPDQDINEQLAVKEFKQANDDPKQIMAKLDSNMPSNQETVTNNELYRPLLGKPKKDYFSDIKLDIKISSQQDQFQSLDVSKVKLLNDKLNQFENIQNKDIFIVVNKNIAINNLINDPNDEINEGGKIIKWINDVLQKKVFSDLITHIHEGYVYITRKGVNVLDTITKDLVNLKYFGWQEGKPINYHTLKYVIFQNEYQQNLGDNIEQKREAEDILSQEYVIALQPSPLYQLWTLKRLIMIWYSDPVIEKHIRKIKVLINQYRCDPSKDYNNKNGLLGSILIYPRYGVKSTKELISKIEYYFSLYIDENTNPRFQDIQWIGSNPSYFIKKNSLMFYTNGSIELKNYIQDSISNTRQGVVANGLTTDMTEFVESERVMGI